jgi:glucokinase
LLTLGTGVGGGILINGQLYQGLGQMAGHLGHVCLNTNDDVTSILGMPGSLEYAMGNYSVQQRSHGRYASTWDLVTAHRQGDYFATYLWLDAVRSLALGISSFINALSPDAVVLSGGITLAETALFDPLAAFLAVYEFRPGGKQTPILKAEFTDMAGAMGAAAFAVQRGA